MTWIRFTPHTNSISLSSFVPHTLTDDITMTADGVDTYQIVKDANRYKWVHYHYTNIFIHWHVYMRIKLFAFFRPIFQGGEPNWRNLNHGSCWTYAFANEKPFPARRKGVCNRKRRLVSNRCGNGCFSTVIISMEKVLKFGNMWVVRWT